MTGEPTNPGGQEPTESNKEFTPNFGKNNLEFLLYMANERSTTNVSDEQIATVKDMVERVFGEEGTITKDHCKGYFLTHGMVVKPYRRFGQVYMEMQQEGEPEGVLAQYVIDMQRRDLFANFMYGVDIVSQGEEAADPTIFGVKSNQEIVDIYQKLNDYKTDPQYRQFWGEIGGFILNQRDEDEKKADGIMQKMLQRAGLGLNFFMYFNHIIGRNHSRREEILEGMDVRSEDFPYVDIMDENSMRDLLNSSRRLDIARLIANYFTDFNSPPWYNL